jgi:hypothetical protein
MILARQFAVAISIAILIPMLVYYGVTLIQPYPNIHNETHVVVTVRVAPTTPEGWKAWEEEHQTEEKRHKEQMDAIDKATSPFFRTLFFLATPLGLVAIFVGSYLGSISVGAGLIFGGIATVTDGYWGYWKHLDNWIQFVSVLIGLCIVVFVGYRQFTAARNPPT